MRFRDSASDHGIGRGQIEEVLANRWDMTKWFPIHEDEKDNSQDTAVGFDAEGALIEIGITYADVEDIIFHPDVATRAWQARYNEG